MLLLNIEPWWWINGWIFVCIWKHGLPHALEVEGHQWCDIFHYHWRTASIKLMLLFSNSRQCFLRTFFFSQSNKALRFTVWHGSVPPLSLSKEISMCMTMCTKVLWLLITDRRLSSFNKRAQRALGRSPGGKVKGHSGAIYRGPLMLSTKYW